MKTFLNPYNCVMQFITKIVYSVWLNILWILCCIPIITIGPATTALFYCCQHIVNDTDGNITKQFFHSFKTNFKQSTTIGIIMTVLGIILSLDGYILNKLSTDSTFWTINSAFFIIVCIIYFMVIMYLFPLLAHFKNTTKNMIKNSFILSIRYLLCTILMLFIYFAMIFITVRIFTPIIIFGFGTCAFLCSLLLKNILLQLE